MPCRGAGGACDAGWRAWEAFFLQGLQALQAPYEGSQVKARHTYGPLLPPPRPPYYELCGWGTRRSGVDHSRRILFRL